MLLKKVRYGILLYASRHLNGSIFVNAVVDKISLQHFFLSLASLLSYLRFYFIL